MNKMSVFNSKNIFTASMGITIFLCFILIHSLPAQSYQETQYKLEMEQAVELMDQGKYKEADGKFKKLLRDMEVLPAEISFYFGKNSYFLNQHKQAINWLNKYIELKGTKGRFFEESVSYLDRSEEAYKLETRQNAKRVARELSRKTEFDCKGKTHFRCPLCKGEGVLIKPGRMNNTIYQPCPFCEGFGFLSCEQYKKYLKGELKSDY